MKTDISNGVPQHIDDDPAVPRTKTPGFDEEPTSVFQRMEVHLGPSYPPGYIDEPDYDLADCGPTVMTIQEWNDALAGGAYNGFDGSAYLGTIDRCSEHQVNFDGSTVSDSWTHIWFFGK